jgi:hypothetical protein
MSALNVPHISNNSQPARSFMAHGDCKPTPSREVSALFRIILGVANSAIPRA